MQSQLMAKKRLSLDELREKVHMKTGYSMGSGAIKYGNRKNLKKLLNK